MTLFQILNTIYASGDDALHDDDPLPGNEESTSPFKNHNTTNNNIPSMTTISSPVTSVDVANDHMQQISEDHTGNADENDANQDNKTTKYFTYVKIGILLCVWGLFTGFLMTTNEKVIDRKQIAIPAQMPKGKSLLFCCLSDVNSYSQRQSFATATILLDIFPFSPLSTYI